MKTIQQITSWINGQSVKATILNAYAINVSLGTSAKFFYVLFDDNLVSVAEGNLTMTGEAYTQWEVDSYAWDWVAAQLNLTITGDFIPPAPPEPTLEPIVTEETIVDEAL